MGQLAVRHDPVSVSLDVVWEGSSGKQDARMSEISLDGCFIDSRIQGRALGDIVEFKVHLPGGPWVPLKGELVLEEYPMGFGLRFTGLSVADRQLLSHVISANGGNTREHYLEEVEAPKTSSMGVLSEQRSVLIADDDPLTLSLVSAIVESEDYRAVGFTDGRQALRALQEDATFSVASFDMRMPHMQGLDLILYMKRDERLRGIPVGMITAEQDPKVWDDSVAAGASVFLAKPFTPEQLQMMLRMLASKARK